MESGQRDPPRAHVREGGAQCGAVVADCITIAIFVGLGRHMISHHDGNAVAFHVGQLVQLLDYLGQRRRLLVVAAVFGIGVAERIGDAEQITLIFDYYD